ncbi:DUF899 domain-containing protein [Phragmitibacter flavus]|uniref:DUF899 domain-containing protein n=1 Tax=Phragmitibacter flavus TaxID=2576071 RepID=A0A5R8KFY6_9BACT|nr:thioredoxin family protein [Phragmitibacter flavus]TLD70875.1 DUF899 domain-containing protein [Phragmitibacter flavus]
MNATINTFSHPIVNRSAWLEARKALLQKEKSLTRMRDQLNAERQQLPWVKLDKSYQFDTTEGPRTLAQLFKHRSQLYIYHFMFGPDWKEGCVGCSFLCDHLQGAIIHLENHDVTPVVISRAPLEEIQAFKKRMGWTYDWVSSFNSDFNYDFEVSFTPEQMNSGSVPYNFQDSEPMIEELSGSSAFYKDESGQVFHTYSAFARGDESLLGTYMILDMMPKGRNEHGPRNNLSDWVRHHDRYQHDGHVDKTGRYHESPPSTCECAPSPTYIKS